MTLITINREKCTKDGLCLMECPLGLLVAGPEKYPGTIERADEYCFACGHCIAVCPHGALTLRETKPETLSPSQKIDTVKGDELLHLMKSRRSIRRYKEKPVPRELLERLINTASYGPTAKNQQTVEWIVLEKREAVHDLARLIIEGMRKAEAMPSMVKAFDEGKDVVFRGAPHLIITHLPSDSILPAVDSTIALTYLELAAWTFGLGTCWAGFLIMAASNNPAVEAHLGIPEGHRLCGALMLGYPGVHYQRIPPRKQKKILWK